MWDLQRRRQARLLPALAPSVRIPKSVGSAPVGRLTVARAERLPPAPPQIPGGNANIRIAMHISLRVPQPGITGLASFEVS